MAKKIESIKHNKDKRAHIPSKEEAGYEEANPKVQQGKKTLELLKNPVVHRGQDPELFWLNKYGNDDRDELLQVDIRSLYRHEHIAPETLIENLYKVTEVPSAQGNLFNDLFGNALEKDELDKVSEYYHHQDGWTNRLIQGDSHLVMASLLEREGMAGQVQAIYIDPPYGIKYSSNWQIQLNNRTVGENDDESLTGEAEVIKAFRDTWENGVHSYLSYLRDRLLIAKELLTETGSCFVQIGDENVHLVRTILDEVFGAQHCVSQISVYKQTAPSNFLDENLFYVLWYAKDKEKTKYRQLFLDKPVDLWARETKGGSWGVTINGNSRKLTPEEKSNTNILPDGAEVYQLSGLTSPGGMTNPEPLIFEGKKYYPPKHRHWSTDVNAIQTLVPKNRIEVREESPWYKKYHKDFPLRTMTNVWSDTSGKATERFYVVQTQEKVIQRCILMTTDPGDLILDPTCGSGTTAFVGEQFGRRWITIDTSRIALNIAKQRLMISVFPYYKLYDETSGDIRQGFIYKTVPHIMLKSLANDEPPSNETLYDRPEIDNKKLRVSGPFTVETLQNFEPVAPEFLEAEVKKGDDTSGFEETVKQHLMSAGVKNGRKDERVIFSRVEQLSHSFLHAEGFYANGTGEKKAYIHIGPKFGTVSKNAVNETVKECRLRGDAQWLIILGFSFESDIVGSTQTMNMGKFEVTKARIHDDLMQDGLKKKPGKNAASFVTIGEPDIVLLKDGKTVTVEIQGLDIYDPIRDEVKARNVSDIAYWTVDDDYDGSNFIVKQVFFCGGDKDEFDKWKKGLESLAKDSTKKKVEKTLKIEIDEEAFGRLYGHISHPIEVKKKGQKIAVRVISQFGEETMKVLTV